MAQYRISPVRCKSFKYKPKKASLPIFIPESHEFATVYVCIAYSGEEIYRLFLKKKQQFDFFCVPKPCSNIECKITSRKLQAHDGRSQ